MSATLAKIDELILNLTIKGDLIQPSTYFNVTNTIEWEKEYKYESDDMHWLQQCDLPLKLWKPRIAKCGATFLIIGSENNNECYVYDTINNKLDLIELDNNFPQCVADETGRNRHKILLLDDMDNESNEYTIQYLLFGNDGVTQSSAVYMIKCLYNIKKNSLKFINITNNFDTKYLLGIDQMKNSFKINL
eukprot:406330_1